MHASPHLVAPPALKGAVEPRATPKYTCPACVALMTSCHHSFACSSLMSNQDFRTLTLHTWIQHIYDQCESRTDHTLYNQ